MKKNLMTILFTLVLSLMFTTVQAQNVSGKVSDDQGPLIGATVAVKGTSTGTVTDQNGNYQLNVKPGSTLVFSYVGMTTQEIKVGSKKTINVTLKEDIGLLEDLVVIGYGVQKKSDLTGAVASVKEQDLKNRSTSDAAAALQGKVAGVQIMTNNGAPGTGSEIRVRGMSSNSGNLGPLLIVDGLKVDNIQYLDPDMIESIEVLKDAASAAIYGVEAGNGVVLVTTKNGKKATNGHIFYNAQFQCSSLARDLKVLNAADYIAFGKEWGFIDDNTLSNYNYDGSDISWQDEVFEPTWSNRHTIGFQGGNEKGSFFAAINNIHNNGIFKGDKDVYDRLSFQANAEYKIKPWLTVGTNNNIEKWKTKSVSQQNDNGTALLAAITTDPLFGPICTDDSQLTNRQRNAIQNGIAVLKNEKGQYYRVSPISGETQSSNPFIKRDAVDGYNEGISVRGMAYLNFQPINELVFTSRLGYRIAQSNSHSYEFPFEANEFVRRTTYSITGSTNASYYYQWENFLNYTKTFAEKHSVNAMVGMSWVANHWDNTSVTGEGENILKGYEPNFRYIDYLLDDAKKTVSNAPGDSKNLSYFGRVTYSYDNRYSIQANFRADAFDSSKLPKSARWGYFPSFSAGWTISNEKFIKDNISSDVLSFLKIRASWGKNGNINVLSGYPYAAVINANSDWYQFTPGVSTMSYGSVTNGLPNPDLEWETSNQIDLGLDARFLNNRLSFGFDYFHKKTEGLLVNVTPVIETGVGQYMMNAGNVKNSGFEFELGWQDRIGDFKYSVNANLSTLKNEMTYLDQTVDRIQGVALQGSGISTVCMPGHSLWFLRGYEVDHIDDTGAPVFKDIDGNGVWDTNDMTDLGSGLPKVTYGITINMEYKGFDFLLFGAGAAGNKILPQAWRSDRPYCNNYEYFYKNSWTPENHSQKFPSVANWSTEVYSSNLTVFSGNYFKFKTIQLGYTIPKDITKKFFVDNLRVFASLENFFTITNYIGLDPECATTNTSNGLGIDMGTYPTAKQVIFGLNLSF
ncbi:MAG: TonB-dependent receptor [Prevotellaceae bacterium]|nr:TonB-dependent receptor [Prevotellaceae bacterium]